MSNNEIGNSHLKLAAQHEEIRYLKEKLNTQNEDFEKIFYEELRKPFNELEQWAKEAKINLKQTDEKQSNIIERQLKELEKSLQTETALRKINDCQTEQLDTLKREKQCLSSHVVELDTELCTIKRLLSEKCDEVENLSKQIHCQRDEILSLRQDLEERDVTVGQLEDKCKDLDADVACANKEVEQCRVAASEQRKRYQVLEGERAKLVDANAIATAAGESLKTDVTRLSEVAECRARKLQVAEAERDEAERCAANERCRADRLEAQGAELREADERERVEATAREQQLKREVGVRDQEVRRLGQQVVAMQRDAVEAASEVAVLKTRARTNDILLANVKRLAEARDRIQQELHDRLDRERQRLSAEVLTKASAMSELERQVCLLREEIVLAGNNRQCNVSKPPSIIPRAADSRDSSSGIVTTDDSYINGLKQLYHDLKQSNIQ